ncbi:MAG: GNAT family N-acetyltransferase [Bacteroidetes bacterium]|nr:GNAT family N-acetyltransferase [Bacteroidota bacterium]
MIVEINSEAGILRATSVMNALRPQLNVENIVPILLKMMQNGYHLIGYEADGVIAAALGYRFTEHLHWGKAIYIDDLTTIEAYRKRGFACKLLDHVKTVALAHQCNQIHLDSGLGANRYDAHRFYLNYGFNITSHNFAMALNK